MTLLMIIKNKKNYFSQFNYKKNYKENAHNILNNLSLFKLCHIFPMISNACVDESWNNKRRCRSIPTRFAGNRDIYMTGETICELAAIKVSPRVRECILIYITASTEYHYISQ